MTFPLGRLDPLLVLLGLVMTVAVSVVAAGPGESTPFVLLLVLAFLAATTVAFAAVPHFAIAACIPIFATLPTLKTLFVEEIGPLKDGIVMAAVAAAVVVGLTKMRNGQGSGIDRRVGLATAFVLALYVLNLGGGFEREAFDAAWLHGVRLTWEPLLLLLAGLVLGTRRTLRWAVASLLLTAVAIALYGLWQQYVGQWHLVDMGYSFEHEVRTINGTLRSFGTLDDSFAYASLLLLPLAALFFYVRPRPLSFAAGGILLAGLLVAYVRSVAIILVALLALWALRRGYTVPALFLLGAVTVSAFGLLFASGATESRTVQAEPSLYLTINGRTDVWRVALQDPVEWPLGRGVGEVGTAATRASYSISRDDPGRDVSAVDSAYFATIADIGFLGLGARLALLAILGMLAWQAAKRGLGAGWFAGGLLVILMVDALTRDSFTSFPTAFLGLLLLGLALAAAREELMAERGAS